MDQLGSTAHIEGIHTVITDYPLRPVVVDPAQHQTGVHQPPLLQQAREYT